MIVLRWTGRKYTQRVGVLVDATVKQFAEIHWVSVGARWDGRS